MKKISHIIFLTFGILATILPFSGCGIYSLSGATITGKTLYMPPLENKALNVVPTLSSTLTAKLQNRILSQTGLAPVNNQDADYHIIGAITNYAVSVSGTGSAQNALASQNRLTISISIKFVNKKDPKASFDQTFSRFADYPSTVALETQEATLIETIGDQLADDIFNKAFVNW